MKVQINEESAKKFTRQYFEKQKVVQKTYEYKYTSGDKPMMHIAFNIDINFFMPTGVTITSILENNKVFSAVCYKVISSTAYFIIYSSGQITLKMKKVTTRGLSLNTKLVTFNSGTFPILYNSYFLNYGSSGIFPMIGLKIVGPVTSGTEFYVCSAGVYGSSMAIPDINMLNKEWEG